MLGTIDITSYLVVPVILICCLIGYVIKNYTKLNNKNIPVIMLIVGSISNIGIALSNGDVVTVSTVLAGAISGLASSGFYDVITKSLFPKKEDLEGTIANVIKNDNAYEETDGEG